MTWQELEQSSTDCVGRVPSDQLCRRRVADHHTQRRRVVGLVQAEDREGDRDALDEVDVAACRPLGLPARRLVDDDAEPAADGPVVVAFEADPLVQVALSGPRVADAVVHLHVGAGGDASAAVDHCVQVLGVHVAGEEREPGELGRLETQQVRHA